MSRLFQDIRTYGKTLGSIILFLLIFSLGVFWMIAAPYAVGTVSAMVAAAVDNLTVSPAVQPSAAELEKKISRDFFEEIGRDNLLTHRSFAKKKSPEGTEMILDLSLERAIELACESHLLTRLAEESIDAARGQEWQAVSALLPHIGAESFLQRTGNQNFRALGFKAGGMSGPFNTFDARFRMQQKLLDFSDFEKFQASRMGVLIAKYEEKFSRQKVVFLTAVAYLEGLRALSELKAAVADMELAERLFAQARRQQEVGIATGVDVARSETRVAQNKLRHEKAQMDVHNALIGLQRVTGLPYDTSLRLKNSLFFIAEPVQSADSAVTTAESTRMEMQIANDRVRMTHYQLNAARAERLPTISFDGGVGLSGLGMDETARLVGDAVFFVRVPIFEGGQIAGAVKESKSVYRQQKISYEDLKRQVGEDVHMALWAMDTRVEQVRAAAKVYELARRELQLAGNRFKQGVGDNVEVVNAQTALTNARDEYISALNDYHNTRMNLYFALGQVESFYLQKSE